MAIKNDYRRVFIMLRPIGIENGTGGFCRIETRAGRGQIVFSTHVDIASGELRALLVTREDVADCGELRVVRAQGVLACDIERDAFGGRSIDEYAGAVVMHLNAGKHAIALAGAMGKEKLDIARIERMLKVRYGTNDVARAAQRREAYSEPEVRVASVQTIMDAYEAAATDIPSAAPSSGDDYPTFAQEIPDTSSSFHHDEAPMSSGEWVGICVDVRDQYERSPAVSPFSGMDDVQFKRIGMMVEQYGMDHYILGVRFRYGKPEALCYGVPGSYRSFPPPGLEGYRWRGTSDGKGGYWLSWLDAITGDPMP